MLIIQGIARIRFVYDLLPFSSLWISNRYLSICTHLPVIHTISLSWSKTAEWSCETTYSRWWRLRIAKSSSQSNMLSLCWLTCSSSPSQWLIKQVRGSANMLCLSTLTYTAFQHLINSCSLLHSCWYFNYYHFACGIFPRLPTEYLMQAQSWISAKFLIGVLSLVSRSVLICLKGMLMIITFNCIYSMPTLRPHWPSRPSHSKWSVGPMLHVNSLMSACVQCNYVILPL